MKASELQNLDIAIVGGGYGGAAAAVALSRIGADVHVYEQATEIREVGAGIGLRPPTLELFRTWGIFDEMAAVSSPSDCMEILTATGELIVREEWPGIHEYAQENKTRLIHRGDFVDTFLKLIPEDRIHLGHRMTSVEDKGDRATVTFANGTEVSADLVIGADGIRSLVRNQLFSDKPPVFSGSQAFRAVISADDAYGMVKDDNFRLYVGDNGAMVYFLPLRHRNQVSFDITALSNDDTWAPEVTGDYISGLLDGFDERLQAIARNLDMAAVTSRGVYDIDPIDQWHSDSVVLVGDAAHSMLHHQGQGANQAIQDAGGLADALVAADSVKDALVRFQAERMPVAHKLQRISRQQPDVSGSVETAFPETTSL